MKKLDQQTLNFTDEHIANIAAMFPHCVTEVQDENGTLKKAIDFDLLKQELSANIVEGPKERYRIDWPGKRASLVSANTPITKTLRPAVEESVDFDTTENLYIEGDNLEALKLLQESYLGAIKMIYIDPPYNTGKDFVYKDNFTRSKEEELEVSGQVDEEGGRLVANLESNGRFHSDWLSMMYPRLRLARNLLKDDGVIFISIDDNEVHNLRKICDEIFGEENFEGHIHWRRRHNQPNDKTKMIGLVTEHILAYARSKQVFKRSGVGKIELTGSFSNPDNDPKGDWASKPWKVGSDQSGSKYIITTPTGKLMEGEWMGEYATFKQYLEEGRIYFPNNGNGSPRKKYYKFEREEEGQCATNWWSHDQFGHNQEANDEVTNLFNIKNIFSNPKPTKLIKNLLNISNAKQNDIILDFFSGSATTADAVLRFNAEYNEELSYILVQLPEDLDESIKSADSKTKKQLQTSIDFLDSIGRVHTITEIGKERIRRAGKKIIEDNADKEGIENLDIGFRVLKIDESNMKDIYFTPDAVDRASLFDTVDHIKEDRTPEDLLFGVLVDWGVDLTLPIRRESIHGKTVFFVGHDDLTACFDEDLDIDFIKKLAGKDAMRVVFKESGFKDDETKINAEQIFTQLSPGTDLRVI